MASVLTERLIEAISSFELDMLSTQLSNSADKLSINFRSSSVFGLCLSELTS